MNIRTQDGRTFSGTAKQIVQQMCDAAPFNPSANLDEYIDWVVMMTGNMGEAVDAGAHSLTIDERASNLIAELLRVGFVAIDQGQTPEES